MAWYLGLSLFVWSFCLAAGFTLVWLNWRAWRRQRQLNALLTDLCVRAFMLRHAPIWQPWSEMTGLDLKIVPVKREAKRD